MSSYFAALINQLSQRSAEATLSILGISNPTLRQFLSQQFNSPFGNENNFLANPVFEAIFGWQEANQKMDNLAGSLLERKLIDAMDKPPSELKDYAFRKNWYPYQHQWKAWEKLAATEPQSVVITSGTGSGKTECFMIPVLNDLVRRYEIQRKPLVGVQALFIYPLNALINSQRDRLRAWTHAFDDNIRFCLYNGNTKESVPASEQAKTPNEILSRKLLRTEPAPLLVTNITMLEYMLVRQIDAPILRNSQGQLRWIIIDEAHSYLGSQAAELSLLLRRAMHGFGVQADKVRFIATSATIGDKDSDVLQAYLADLAGIDKSRVTVIGGKRDIPRLPPENALYATATLDELNTIDNDSKRYQALASQPTSLKIRQQFTTDTAPKTLTQLSTALNMSQQDTLKWLDVCTKKTEKTATEPPFLPLRAHLFHQVINGLWCCVDKNCTHKINTLLATDEWKFGYVYSQQREYCQCGAPVYELVFCADCNSPHLQAHETNTGQLVQVQRQTIDEFSLHIESEDDNEDESQPSIQPTKIVALTAQPTSLTHKFYLSKQRELNEPKDGIEIHIVKEENETCGDCDFDGEKRQATFRRCLLGTPFYVSNTIPTLLEFCPDGDNPSESPARGRRLITFTDSRQGTARLAVKVQQDSERNRVRGLVYEIAAKQFSQKDDKQRIELEQKRDDCLAKAEKYQAIAEVARDYQQQADKLAEQIKQLGQPQPITWQEMIAELKTQPDIARFMFYYYRDLNGMLFSEETGRQTLIEILLLCIFYYRPKRANSLETLGLVSVQYPALSKIEKVPVEWQKLNLSLSEWQDFLKLCLDFYVRGDKFVTVPYEWIHWMGITIYPRVLLAPDSNEFIGKGTGKWVLVRKNYKRQHRLIRILVHAMQLNLSNKAHEDIINEIMRAAWRALTQETQILTNVAGTLTYQMKPEQMAFSCMQQAWICPITHRFLDNTFKDITPYLPYKAEEKTAYCKKVTIPVLPIKHGFNSEQERLNSIREWIGNNEAIAECRKQNLWTDLSDRILEGGVFFRTAEHSAQQPAARLQQFEKQFKEQQLNVLSCSTTMEMGVDIGGITSVAMNNVPPHPANYLQRAGRAGRRQESRAIAFTICKDNPHERSVFQQPLWAFTTHIKPPAITLSSEKIVMRHVHSLLLSHFLKHVVTGQSQDNTKLNCGWFFIGDAQVNHFSAWLNDVDMPKDLVSGLKSVIKGSGLQGKHATTLLKETHTAITEVKDKWLAEYEPLQQEFVNLTAKIKDNDPYKKRVERDLKRLTGEYLLSELATRGFLPCYGFPTGIASFDLYSIHDYKQLKNDPEIRDDNRAIIRAKPSRDLSIAIREYAPSNDIVLNGLVYRCAGLTLNWHIPTDQSHETQKLMTIGRCHQCGTMKHAISSNFSLACKNKDCDATLLLDNCREFIEPAGFAVDFYSEPTTDVSLQHYVAVQEPWVTANGELKTEWFGGYRIDNEGSIFYHSSGENGHGYALCWRCGRAESITRDNLLPDVFLKPHKKLRGRPEGEKDLVCEGNEKDFSIKHNLHLGYLDKTDVLEVYLKHPDSDIYINHAVEIDKQIAWTMAVVLRQALADVLGIASDELGFTVKPTTLPNCSHAVATIVIYDNCSGGGGFSYSSPPYFQQIFTKARNYLDCSCEGVCQNCLLGFDTRFCLDYLNRQATLQFLYEYITC
jgi:ATP-dependent helicase YprA (DUF1998 family)